MIISRLSLRTLKLSMKLSTDQMSIPISNLTTKSSQTKELGKQLGHKLSKGDVVTLSGQLGSGKTTFAKGIAQGLEIPDEVTSPSYALISEYHGRLKMYHVDLYRISSPGQYESLAMDEILYGPWVTVIEWPENASPLIIDSITVLFTIEPTGKRTIQIRSRS